MVIAAILDCLEWLEVIELSRVVGSDILGESRC